MAIKYINSFPGYEHIPGPENKGKGRNMYRGIDLGFGGYVYYEPGIYRNVALIDIQNMHGASIIAMNVFGEYTERFAQIRGIRNLIKTRQFDKVKHMFDGKLAKYLEDESVADDLSNALKTAVNACYGCTSAGYENPMRDPRNVNNIVALRGALFMKTLQDEVVAKGFKVAHIKTDSMKIPDATPEIIQFCMDFAEKYGYKFEHEATYDRMCLVNGSTYIAKYDSQGIRNKGGKHANEWTATAAQFQQPYVFKTLFSHEEIKFRDMCETKSVQGGAIYLDMNENLPDVSEKDKWLKKLDTIIGYNLDPNYIPTKPAEKFMSMLREYYRRLPSTPLDEIRDLLVKDIAAGHNYQFIGRVGQFTPILPGHGGGVLTVIRYGKSSAVAGTKGYRWLESESMTEEDKNYIDRSYYRRLVDEAKEAIEEYGDFEWFVSDSEEPAPNFMPEPVEDIAE
jgi:hypothetical protein